MNPSRSVRLTVLGAVAFALVASSASAEEWYDAYEKGLHALQEEQGEQAAALFERAIQRRPEPGTDLITYGTNRVREYSPYLRLAEARLLAGDLDGARQALQRSEARGKEPPEQRARLLAEVEQAEQVRAEAAAPLPIPPPEPATTPPTPLPTPTPTPAAAPPPPPATPAPATPEPVHAPTGAPVTGTLDLRSEPGGATAFLDGRLLGTTPLEVELAVGDYTVTLRHEGAADVAFRVHVEPGRVTRASRELPLVAPADEPSPEKERVASLIVYSDPPGATVYLDDEPMGTTAPGSGRLVMSGVEPGPHRVRATRRGSEEATEDVTVAPSGPTTVRLELDSRAPAPSWPFLVVGAVVLLVGAAALFFWRARRRGDISEAETLAGRGQSATPRRWPGGRSTPTGPTPLRAGDPSGSGAAGGMEMPGVGERFGDYLLLEVLGKGGMARVFRAERASEQVALKRPLSAFVEVPEFRERFLREAEIGRTLHHPNIVRILERGEISGVPYFTMELVDGETLQQRVRRKGAYGARAAAMVVSQVAEALDYAHLKGVVHRDLKPSNIMVLNDDTAKVMDYGLARARRFTGLTVTGAFLGTPDYVAPETAEGRGSDARSDLYSLGVVFYEILTAKKPFVADSPLATIRMHSSEPPTPPSVVVPDVPREIEAIILRLLAKSPDDRYPGAEELLIELREFINRTS